jgi:hypothetical protein
MLTLLGALAAPPMLRRLALLLALPLLAARSLRAFPVNCTGGPCGPAHQDCGPAFGASAPQFHLRSKSCAINDPNGPLWDPRHRVFHLFWQERCAEPANGAGEGPVWGHAASRDFVRWTRLPNALWNDQHYDNSAVYTGASRQSQSVSQQCALSRPATPLAVTRRQRDDSGRITGAGLPRYLSELWEQADRRHGYLAGHRSARECLGPFMHAMDETRCHSKQHPEGSILGMAAA